MPIDITMDGNVALLTLACPKANAINHAFIDALHASLDDVARDDVRALVITGRGRAFSAGLDLVESHGFDRDALKRFTDAFDDVFVRLFTVARPVVAAINGHAIAGGCVLACAADWRVMAAGDAEIGLTEVPLGIPFPIGALEVARHAVPREHWGRCILEGKRLSAYEALRIGLVDRVVDPVDLMKAATHKAHELAELPSGAYARVKEELRAAAVARINARHAASRAAFVEHWFGSDATAKRADVVASLAGKKGGA